MFYFHEILKKRGKFGVIWLAATSPKRLNKRDVYSVDVVKSSNDVMEILTQYPSVSGRRNVHFSLYLSSQLMFGLASVNRIQSDLLFEDARILAGRIGSFRRQVSSSIDLQESASRFRVTFDEPDFENAPIDFGSFSFSDVTSIPFPSYEYFMVSTPKSSEEWQISPGLPEDYRASFVDIGDVHVARPEDISMEAAVPLVPDVESLEMPAAAADDFLTDLFFFEAPASQLGGILEPEHEVAPELTKTLPIIQPDAAIPEAIDATVHPPPDFPESELPIDQLALFDQRTPDVPITGPEPKQRRTAAAEGDTTFPLSPKPDKRPRRTLFDDSETSFVLPAIATTSRRRLRRRYLIIDDEISLSRANLEHNFTTANQRLVRPFAFPDTSESVQSMFTRFGSRIASHGCRRFWPNPRTLPEPDDPARFGAFLEEAQVSESVPIQETSIPESVPVQEIPAPESVPMPEIPVPESVPIPETPDVVEEFGEEPPEELRAEALGDTYEHSVTASKTLLSSRGHRDTHGLSFPTGISSLHVPDLTDFPREDISGMLEDKDLRDLNAEELVIEALEKPQLLVREIEEPQFEQVEESGQSSKRARTCVVSPERTPPPTSPEVPHSPLVEKAIELMNQAFIESPIANMITFTSVIKKSPRTKIYVAKLFSLLLSLHATSVIYVEQNSADGEIYITKGPNYSAF